MPRPTLARDAQAPCPWPILASPTSVCYICKVLVGSRTPYLEPNPRTGIRLPADPIASHPNGCQQLKPNRVSQFQVPGRVVRLLGLEQPNRRRAIPLLANARLSSWSFFRRSTCADHSSVGAQGAREGRLQDESSGPSGVPSRSGASVSACTPRRRRSRTPRCEGGSRAVDQRHRGDHLHPGRRPQPAGALHRADPRRPSEGSPGECATTSCAARWMPSA